jgi:hypothetical protein
MPAWPFTNRQPVKRIGGAMLIVVTSLASWSCGQPAPAPKPVDDAGIDRAMAKMEREQARTDCLAKVGHAEIPSPGQRRADDCERRSR